MDRNTKYLYIKNDSGYSKLKPICSERWYNTRSSETTWYNLTSITQLEKTLPGELLPSTIVTDELKSGIVRVNHSSNPLFNTENKSTQTTYSLSDLLRQQLDASLPLQEIIQASQQGHLTIGSDGSYPSKINKATYSWSFSNKSLICSGSGVIRAANNNPYRVELMGVLASLIALLREVIPNENW